MFFVFMLISAVLVIVLSFFLLRKWQGRRIIRKNIRRIEFYIAGGEISSELCCEMGHSYMQLKSVKKACHWYEKAIEIDPDLMEPYVSLAEIFKKEKEYVKLREAYEKLNSLNSNDPEILRELGWAYYHCNELDRAVNALEQVKNMIPSDIHTRYALGLLYLEQGKKIQAIQEYRELKKLDEKRADELFVFIYPNEEHIDLDELAKIHQEIDDPNIQLEDEESEFFEEDEDQEEPFKD
ncbi:MAG: tetratricopeptide repeat protein [bacterium]|nr:tetratricopeptide repeat protein [bacterium]